MTERVEIGNATLYHGDCLEILPTLESKADAVITDPPFSSGARTDAGKSVRGAMVRGAKWQADWFSHDNLATHGFLYLMRLVGIELHRACNMPATGHFFIDWRMFPNLYGAIEASGWIVKNTVIWDKQHFGMGTNYRNQHEFIIYAEKGDVEFQTHSVGNVLRFAREESINHPTEKPIGLIERILSAATKTGQTVIDPFMGSGSTGVACINLERRFIGIEIDQNYFDIACERIDQAQRQTRMFA